jgi:PadR family transcriptional regulator, regulatory protein PadR
MVSAERPDFPKGTLDMLILKIVALGPIHGYAISQRIQQISKDVFQLTQGSLYPALSLGSALPLMQFLAA